MSYGGAPTGSPFAGQTAAASARAAGLPFAGVPPEVRARVAEIEAREPVHPEPDVTFDPRHVERERFTLHSFLRPHAWALFGTFLLVLVATLAGQAGPRLLTYAIDHGVTEKNPRVLVVAFVVYLVAIAVSMVASGARIRATAELGYSLLYRLRVRVFSHLQRLSLDFYTEERAGKLLTRMTSDIEALTNLFQDGLVDLAVNGLTLLVITFVLMTMNAKLTLIMLLAVVPAMIAITLWFRGASDRGYSVVRDRIAEVLTDLAESLAGIRLIAAHNRRARNVEHHHDVLGAHQSANLHVAKIGTLYGPAGDLISLAGQLAILWIGGDMVSRGELTLGELTAFLLYLAAFFTPIQALVQLYNTYQAGQSAVVKLADLLATEPTVRDAEGARTLPPLQGHIQLEHVSFGYREGSRVLEDLTLEIKAGETFAIVGPTGAGKSTISKLIARFYDPDAGSVRIDGVDLREVTQHSLRSQLGVVPQEPFLFHGTIRENIAFARPGASEHEIQEASDAVGLSELLAKKPLGLDTPCFERGASLSAGERQLVALARAFLAKPSVLLLDEATSNVDMQSEAQIEHALDRLLQNRTAILIAHRLSTARRAGRIAFVDSGRVIELGSHEELLARGGRYAELVSAAQASASSQLV
jgi:ATP-binding cassette subfamily B protein